jgi:hypothetical protein
MSGDKTDGGGGCLFLVIILGGLIYWAYSGLDSNGWISHSQQTVITAKENWLVGESKTCFSAPLDVASARTLNKEVGDVFSSVDCDDGSPAHDMKITFFGRANQPDHSGIIWRCTRNDTSSWDNSNTFTCKETGAY